MNISLSSLIKRCMAGRSLNEFAKAAGISAGNLSRILRGQIPSAALLNKIAAAGYGVSISELLCAAGYASSPEPQKGRIPIYGTVAGGLPINAYEEILGFVDIDYDLSGDSSEYFALKVRGNSMDAAHMPDGSIIIVKKCDIINEGEIGVFVIDGDATVKKFHRDRDHILLLPVSTDSSHHPQIYSDANIITVLGKVVRSVVTV